MTQTLLSLVDQHLPLAYTFLFAVCLGEALFIIGLFVPSTVVLIAVGAMIGGQTAVSASPGRRGRGCHRR